MNLPFDVIVGDCRETMRKMPAESVDCCITSPPYFGLRDYNVVGQIGLEVDLNEHLQVLLGVFREVWRVLKKDGTLWLNYGDAYASSVNGRKAADIVDDNRTFRDKPMDTVKATGLKPKDLMGLPWRLALALQADGWWLRQDIIWSKPNPMPESIKDRCTKSHEYIFLLSKSERYHFDYMAIREPIVADKGNRRKFRGGGKYTGGQSFDDTPVPNRTKGNALGPRYEGDGLRNKRSVWSVATAPFKDAHFATFPPALIEPCVLAGCRPGGLILDPFGGAGTTGLVATRNGRRAVLCELNPDYAMMALHRIARDFYAPKI